MSLYRLLLLPIVVVQSDHLQPHHTSENIYRDERIPSAFTNYNSWNPFPEYYDSNQFKKPVPEHHISVESRQEASFESRTPSPFDSSKLPVENHFGIVPRLHATSKPHWIVDVLKPKRNVNSTYNSYLGSKFNHRFITRTSKENSGKFNAFSVITEKNNRMDSIPHDVSEFVNATEGYSNQDGSETHLTVAAIRILNDVLGDHFEESISEEPFRINLKHLEETAPNVEQEVYSWRRPQRRRRLRGAVIKELVRQKVAKFLSLFTIIQFPNSPCLTAEGINGTCYHHLECRSLGGVPSGPCAHGYGVCCYFQRTCGDVIKQNCTYFVNPGYPQLFTGMLTCTLTIKKANPHVSQIRLDFLDFQLQSPSNGTCIEDQFIVTGQNTNSIVPIICGFNTRQHIYLDVDDTAGPIRLNVLGMSGDFPRRFRIKVTQLKSDSPLKAPKNCLQYYTGTQGTFESFNYNPGPANTPGYLNNLNYAICIKKEPGYCTITYTSAGPFQLINVDEDGTSLTPEGQAGAEIFNCPDDYIIIGGIRLCGERFNDATVEIDFTRDAPVTDTTNGPFIIPVRTNQDINGRGFRINYKQNPCASLRYYRPPLTWRRNHPFG